MFAIFPKLHRCVQRGDIESLAVLVRHYFLKENGRLPALDLLSLLRNAGFAVKPSKIAYHGALVVLDQKGVIQPTMLYNDATSGFEKSFLLAHLLGHFFLQVQEKIVVGTFQTEAYYEPISPLIRYSELRGPEHGNVEQIADNFAAALFLPQKMLEKALSKTDDDSERVAKLFAVPVNCLNARKHALCPKEIQAKIDIPQTKNPDSGRSEGHKRTPNIASGKAGAEANLDHQKRAFEVVKKIQELSQASQGKQDKEGPFKKLRQLAKKLDDSVKL